MISRAMVQAHNAVHSRVGVPPLIWSDQLAKVAQEWANHLLATHTFTHRPNNKFAEHLYLISGSARDAVEGASIQCLPEFETSLSACRCGREWRCRSRTLVLPRLV